MNNEKENDHAVFEKILYLQSSFASRNIFWQKKCFFFFAHKFSFKEMFPLFNYSCPKTSLYKSKPLNAAPINSSVKVIFPPRQHVRARTATYKVLNGPQLKALRSRHNSGSQSHMEFHLVSYIQ